MAQIFIKAPCVLHIVLNSRANNERQNRDNGRDLSLTGIAQKCGDWAITTHDPALPGDNHLWPGLCNSISLSSSFLLVLLYLEIMRIPTLKRYFCSYERLSRIGHACPPTLPHSPGLCPIGLQGWGHTLHIFSQLDLWSIKHARYPECACLQNSREGSILTTHMLVSEQLRSNAQGSSSLLMSEARSLNQESKRNKSWWPRAPHCEKTGDGHSKQQRFSLSESFSQHIFIE